MAELVQQDAVKVEHSKEKKDIENSYDFNKLCSQRAVSEKGKVINLFY